jgi:hypothetical protein
VKANTTGSSYLNETDVDVEVDAHAVLTVPVAVTEAIHLPAFNVKS